MPRHLTFPLLALMLLGFNILKTVAQTPKSRYQGDWTLTFNDGCVDVSYLLIITESASGLSAKVTELDGQPTGVSVRNLKVNSQGALSFMVDAEGYFDLEGTLSLKKDNKDRFTGIVDSDTPIEGVRRKSD